MEEGLFLFSTASVPLGSGGGLSFLWVLFILLPVAGVVARGMFTSSQANSGVLLRRYVINTGDVYKREFMFGLLFIIVWLFAIIGRASFGSIALLAATATSGNVFRDVTPLLLVLLPFLGALVVGITGRTNGAIRDTVATCTAFLSFALAVSMYPLISAGQISYTLPSFMGLGLVFKVDFLGFVFAVLASFIWFLATLYSSEYMRHEHAPTRYHVFMLLSLGGCLGVFVTGDFLSLFLFFEAMTLASYVLVVHAESEEAMAAGRNYLYMGIFGGLCLLVAIMLLFMQTGTTAITPNLDALAGMGNLRFLVATLFFLGFGIKAGAAPLHIWLPQAHPVAPTPASALLSGIMIKTGAYGIIRVFNLLFTPIDGQSLNWQITEQFGFTLIWIGMVTMFMAAVLALAQHHAKRVLAYSSVSQMGYILMGIGAAAYLGFDGGMGFAGLTYHILNHAFFKAGMFLMVGAIYLRTHNLSYDKLGGLWRRFPVTAVAFLVAAAAISGIPGFNGYVSKSLLHHAIVEAWEHHHLASLWYAEKIFTLTGGLTFCYIMRLFSSIFLGKEQEGAKKYDGETFLERLIFAVFAGVIVYGGLAYTHVINRVILPMSTGFTFDSYGLNYVAKTNVWNIHDLGAIAVSLGIGALAFVLLSRIKFNLHLPAKLSVEHLIYKPILNLLIGMFMFVGRIIEFIAEGFQVGSIRPATWLTRVVGKFDGVVVPAIGGHVLKSLTVARDSTYVFFISHVKEVQGYTRHAEWMAFLTLIKVDYNPRGDNLYKKLTLMNLDLCLLIVVMMLVIVFSLRFLTSGNLL
jgi:formate hydrogenlyase subunit 3/multisubunit Na+/H+ antiporter MnhD subunit